MNDEIKQAIDLAAKVMAEKSLLSTALASEKYRTAQVAGIITAHLEPEIARLLASRDAADNRIDLVSGFHCALHADQTATIEQLESEKSTANSLAAHAMRETLSLRADLAAVNKERDAARESYRGEFERHNATAASRDKALDALAEAIREIPQSRDTQAMRVRLQKVLTEARGGGDSAGTDAREA